MPWKGRETQETAPGSPGTMIMRYTRFTAVDPIIEMCGFQVAFAEEISRYLDTETTH